MTGWFSGERDRSSEVINLAELDNECETGGGVLHLCPLPMELPFFPSSSSRTVGLVGEGMCNGYVVVGGMHELPNPLSSGVSAEPSRKV